MIVTFQPESASKMVSVNMSQPLERFRQYGQNQISQLNGSHRGDNANSTYGDVELPKAAPLIFPSASEISTQYKNGFQRTCHVAADYFDRRARASYVSKF